MKDYVAEVFVKISMEEVAEHISNLDCVDDIVRFVMSCIPDNEVAEAVASEMKKQWSDS